MNHKNHVDIEQTIALEKSRLSLEQRSEGGMGAFLVSLELDGEEPENAKESLQELEALIRTLGDECRGTSLQRRGKPIPATFIGSGKVEEIKEKCKADELIHYIAFDQELTPSQIRNLETLIGKPVLDRKGIILQIFRKHARSREARTQVEIANLEYIAPRLSNAWIAWERQRGGGGSGGKLKGAGETQIEMDRRRIKDKIAALKKELGKIRRERENQRKKRMDEWNVVLVGYTNAGKTTLMNSLTDSQLSSKHSLFETLDSSIRKMKGVNNLNILVTDTVGFIRNLPHSLVASFRSTLEEVAMADVLLHVVDISHKSFKEHIKTTEEVLAQIGAKNVPKIFVFTKADLLAPEPGLLKLLTRNFENSICISSYNEEDIKKLRETIVEFLAKNMVGTTLEVASTDAQLLSLIYSHTVILDAQWEKEKGILKVRMSREIYNGYFNHDEIQ